ncbi:ribosomal RNA small subunit methyltransferase A [Patescibacteria group bacterium]|nr:ribosomal RNA small subunit methyltransferase A [Patescibacteria group bacterium]
MVRAPHEIKATLLALGARPEKAFGQNFLIDATVLSSVVTTAELGPRQCVLEIGPGLGVLTEDLLATGASVYAIERDRKFIDHLLTQFGRKGQSFFLSQGDAALLNWNALLPTDIAWKLVSNLPYAISSFALRTALWSTHPASRVVVMLQREVAERALALLAPNSDSGQASLLSLMVALSCSSGKIIRRVAPGSFFPPPKVESALLLLVPMVPAARLIRWGVDPEQVMRLAKQGFAHPRKQLFSTLGVRERAVELAEALQVTKEVRPEALSADQWAALTRLLSPSLSASVDNGDKSTDRSA